MRNRAGGKPFIRILYLFDDLEYLERLPAARDLLRDAQYQLFVMCPDSQKATELRQQGFKYIPWDVSRGATNVLRELSALWQVCRAYRRLRPDLVHHVSHKAVLYGGIAARLCAIPSINGFPGLGHLYVSSDLKMRLLRAIARPCFRFVLRGKRSFAIFQNPDHQRMFSEAGISVDSHSVVIRGSGVCTRTFTPQPEPSGVLTVALVSRMIWDKGIAEFVAASKLVQGAGLKVRFVLVGRPDPANPQPVPEERLRFWNDEGLVDWWGHHTNMPAVYARTNVVCLPSYGEGLPKTLLEAAACGRAIIASDVPGCREVVIHGRTGLLVPARDPEALADGIIALVTNHELRSAMASEGRRLVVAQFSNEVISDLTRAYYTKVLGYSGVGCLADEGTYLRRELSSEVPKN